MTNPILSLGVPSVPGVLSLNFLSEATAIDDDCFLIGDDEGTNIVLDRRGQIWSADKTTSEMIRFINVSVSAFAECIRSFKQYSSNVQKCTSEEDELLCVKELESAIKQHDFRALENCNNWWACVLQQAYDGNL